MIVTSTLVPIAEQSCEYCHRAPRFVYVEGPSPTGELLVDFLCGICEGSRPIVEGATDA